MIILLTMFVLSQTGETWHDRFIEDNCNRCPECCVSEDACVETQPVKAFEPTPCTGILWPVNYTADALEVMQVSLPECKVKLGSARHELKICDDTIIEVRAQCDRSIERFAQLTKKAARIERPWWDNNPLWGGAGFVSGVIVSVLIVSSIQ